MSADQVVVVVAGIAAIGFIAWFFWFKRSAGVRAVTVSDGYQEQMILVKGGYTPDTVRVVAGQPVRLQFRREETAACSEQVVLPYFGKTAALPAGQVVPVEFLPQQPGQFEFTCQMGMLRGRILVEAA